MLEVALVSSFEFLRNPIYALVEGVCVSSHGPVHSVFLAHAGDLAEIEEIEFDPVRRRGSPVALSPGRSSPYAEASSTDSIDPGIRHTETREVPYWRPGYPLSRTDLVGFAVLGLG